MTVTGDPATAALRTAAVGLGHHPVHVPVLGHGPWTALAATTTTAHGAERETTMIMTTAVTGMWSLILSTA